MDEVGIKTSKKTNLNRISAAANTTIGIFHSLKACFNFSVRVGTLVFSSSKLHYPGRCVFMNASRFWMASEICENSAG